MKIRKVDDKPMVIHTKEKAKIHAHEPKGKFFDEYGKELANQPKLLGIYGVATISGIARKINQELIIAGM